jgi:hypothetical protein
LPQADFLCSFGAVQRRMANLHFTKTARKPLGAAKILRSNGLEIRIKIKIRIRIKTPLAPKDLLKYSLLIPTP